MNLTFYLNNELVTTIKNAPSSTHAVKWFRDDLHDSLCPDPLISRLIVSAILQDKHTEYDGYVSVAIPVKTLQYYEGLTV